MLAGKDFYRGSDVPPYNPRKSSGNVLHAVNLTLSLSRQRDFRDFLLRSYSLKKSFELFRVVNILLFEEKFYP